MESLLIVAIVAVIIVIISQLVAFGNLYERIGKLKSLFPNIKQLALEVTPITIEDETTTNVTLISLKDVKPTKEFSLMVSRTNDYLRKNVGTSADFGILKGICDRQLESMEDEIQSSLNIPLYIGLAGTFIGIICGLGGLIGDSKISDLDHLFWGIMAAMIASLVGLILTISNNAAYRNASVLVDTQKEDYYDFIRKRLMPVLSSSMASSLNSLKSVLGHFVDKFGRNLNAYTDSAELLNDNLEKQHLVLEEINKLNLTQVANKTAEIFLTLKNSAESLEAFKNYQGQLNATVQGINDAAGKINSLLASFSDFNAGLSIVVRNQNRTDELLQNFKEAIETHFPTGSEGRDVWRNEFDLLVSDAKEVSDNLSSQLTKSTEHIRDFVDKNRDFFDSFEKVSEVISTLVQYTELQAECYKDMKDEILNLRKDFKDAQIENIGLNKSMLMAIKTMVESIKNPKANNHDSEEQE